MEIIEKLARDLERFALILFFTGEGEFVEEWLSCVNEIMKLKKTSKKIMILSDMNISLKDCSNCTYCRVDREEKESLERLYFTYDFSDRFIMISDRRQYGGVPNYIKTGMITKEEMIQALLR